MDALQAASTEESRANLYCHREAAAWAAKPRELPVTLVTGFLGSGKTSLLRHILSNKSNLRVAAAVNDFAAVNLDAKLVSRVQELGGAGADQVVELSNGCLCCSTAAASGFSEAVWKVLQECDVGKVQYLVVETSGVTDPLSLIGTLDQEFGRLFRVRLDSVVTVVDADTLYAELMDAGAATSVESGVPRQYIASRDAQGVTTFASSVAESQLRCADVVLLNKVDLLGRSQEAVTSLDGARQDALNALTEWVGGEVGPGVRVYPCSQCAVPLDAIMEVAQSNLYDEAMKGVHTHERAESNYVVLDANYGARRVGSRSLQAAPSPSGTAAVLPALSATSRRPLATDYAVRVFESPAGGRALPLAAFQDFVGESFVSCRLMRVKGTVSFVRCGRCWTQIVQCLASTVAVSRPSAMHNTQFAL